MESGSQSLAFQTTESSYFTYPPPRPVLPPESLTRARITHMSIAIGRMPIFIMTGSWYAPSFDILQAKRTDQSVKAITNAKIRMSATFSGVHVTLFSCSITRSNRSEEKNMRY